MKNKQKKLNIVMFGHKQIPSREGGIEVVVQELSTRMVKRGYNVVCYNRKSNKDLSLNNILKYKGIRIKHLFTINKKGLSAVSSSVSGSIKASFSNANIVHIHAEGPAVMSWLPKIFGKKIIVTVHGLDWARSKWNKFASWYIMRGEKNAVKYADDIIVLSKNMQNYFLEKYNRKTVLIPNGVSKPIEKKTDLITKTWGLKKDSYILFVGRLVPEKGIHYLINAFKDINRKKLVICGDSSDTKDYVDKLKQTDSNVIFTGFQEGWVLDELYSNAYVCCFPSDLEGMSLGLLEAMSYGNCCLVSDIPECTEVVEDKAVTFNKSDEIDLKNKIIYLIDNPDIVKKYKDNSSDYICNKYNWDKVVDETLKVYA